MLDVKLNGNIATFVTGPQQYLELIVLFQRGTSVSGLTVTRHTNSQHAGD